jgi:hypothetical protein
MKMPMKLSVVIIEEYQLLTSYIFIPHRPTSLKVTAMHEIVGDHQSEFRRNKSLFGFEIASLNNLGINNQQI